MRDRVLERRLLAPFLGRPHAAVAADLVEEAVDLEVMVVRIAEFDRDLAAARRRPSKSIFTPASRRCSRARKTFVERRDFESEVMHRRPAPVFRQPPISARQW
jgi:hypothetical protein